MPLVISCQRCPMAATDACTDCVVTFVCGPDAHEPATPTGPATRLQLAGHEGRRGGR